MIRKLVLRHHDVTHVCVAEKSSDTGSNLSSSRSSSSLGSSLSNSMIAQMMQNPFAAASAGLPPGVGSMAELSAAASSGMLPFMYPGMMPGMGMPPMLPGMLPGMGMYMYIYMHKQISDVNTVAIFRHRHVRGLFDKSAECHTSVCAVKIVSIYFKRSSSCMKLSTKILDSLCRIKKKTTMLGGGGRIICQTSECSIILSCLSFSRETFLQMIVNQAKHNYV